MTTGMIVLAGGIGKRIGRPFPKQFLLLGGKPLIIHVLEKARAIPEIERVVITCPEGASRGDPRSCIANHGFGDKFTCIVGGVVTPGIGLQRACSRSTGSTRSSSTRPSGRWSSTAEFRALHRGRGRERDVRHPDPVHGPQGPRVRRGPARARRARQRPAAPEVRPRQAAARPTRRRAATARSSPRTPGSSTSTSASRSGSCPARTQNIKITVPTDTVTAEAIYADVLGRGS